MTNKTKNPSYLPKSEIIYDEPAARKIAQLQLENCVLRVKLAMMQSELKLD